MKRTLLAAFFSVLTASAVFALERPFFSGTTGFLAGIENDSDTDGFDPTLSAEAYFAGQFDFSGKFFLRGEFYVMGAEIFDDDTFGMNGTFPNAYFRVQELSATYKANSESASHYLTLYKGNYEPIGSDLFLQRQFGIKPIRSYLTDSYHGVEGASFYPMYSTGASYTLHTASNKALAFSFYKDKAIQEPGSDNNALNFDVRFASLYDNVTIDALAGFAFPMDEKDGSGFAFGEVQFHTGVNILFGNKKTTMFLTQLAVDRIVLKEGATKSSDMDMENLYILVEPRFPISDFYFAPAFFNIPAKSAKDMMYLRPLMYKTPDTESIIGFNFNLVNENFYIGSTKSTIGVHGTIAMTDIKLDDFSEEGFGIFGEAEKIFALTPYVSIEVFGGTVSASLSIDMSEFMDDLAHSMTATVGLRTSF
ncbi:MAG: hypothetical protein KBS64_03150 [Treponema sp.]|nr:hypothetical protein [Candidatus Treponema equi]